MQPTYESVIETIAEFNRMGEEAFLAKYEKGHSPTTHLLRWQGRDYPMKALWVASHRPAANPSTLDYRRALKGFPRIGFDEFINKKNAAGEDVMSVPTRESVLDAINEFLLVGRDAFLTKYTNGNAPKSKYVRYAGSDIPLKALWSAAHIPPAFHRDFSHRDAEPGISALGFRVVTAVSESDVIDDEDQFEMEAQEGERTRRETEVIKRNRAIVAAAKLHHKPVCMACDFDFETFYGKIGLNFIEAHHINPLSSRDGVNEPTSIRDFAMLCSNCHRMVHRSIPCLTVDELKMQIVMSTTN